MLAGGFSRAGAAVRRGLAILGGGVPRRTYAGKPVQPVPEQAELTANQVWLRGLFHEVSSSSSEKELHALHTQSVRMETEFHMAVAKHRCALSQAKEKAVEAILDAASLAILVFGVGGTLVMGAAAKVEQAAAATSVEEAEAGKSAPAGNRH